jgi:HEAT repeat protein
MAGVVALGWLGQQEDIELLERIARRGREPMASAALASLVRLDAPPAFPIIRRWLRRGAQPLPAVVGTALLQAPRGALADLVRHEAKTHANEMPGLLRIIGLRRDGEGLMAVRGVLVDPEAPVEALAAGLHALSEIGRPSDVVYASRLLSHPNWAVRVRAVHAVARLGGRACTYRLARLLDDADPWVRRRAAEAVTADPTVKVDTSVLSERAQLAFEEALTKREVAA